MDDGGGKANFSFRPCFEAWFLPCQNNLISMERYSPALPGFKTLPCTKQWLRCSLPNYLNANFFPSNKKMNKSLFYTVYTVWITPQKEVFFLCICSVFKSLPSFAAFQVFFLLSRKRESKVCFACRYHTPIRFSVPSPSRTNQPRDGVFI